MIKALIDKKSNIVILLLILIVVILGGLIFKKYQPMFGKSSPAADKQQAQSPEDSTQQTSLKPEVVPDFIDKLTEDEKMVLRLPLPSASDEIRNQHFAVAMKLAKDAEFLELGDCKPARPLVMNLPFGEKLTVSNSSSGVHTMSFDQDSTYTLAAGSKEAIEYDFPNGPGLYGYNCDGKQYSAGFINVLPEASEKDQ